MPKSFYVDDLEADVAEALDDAIAAFKKLGVQHRRRSICRTRPLVAAAAHDRARRRGRDLSRAVAAHARRDDYGAQVRNRLQNGLAYSAVEYLEALRWRGPALAAHLEAIGKCDAMLAPASRAVAPTIAETDVGGGPNAEAGDPGDDALHAADQLSRAAGAGRCRRASAQHGLPIGLQLIGRPFGDETLVALGSAFQGATDHHTEGADAVMTPMVEIRRPARALQGRAHRPRAQRRRLRARIRARCSACSANPARARA